MSERSVAAGGDACVVLIGGRVDEFGQPEATPAPTLLEMLGAAEPLLAACAEQFSGDLLANGTADSQLTELLARLDADGRRRLLRGHTQHLRLLTATSTTDAQITDSAQHGGRIHALLGIAPSIYAKALAQFRKSVVAALSDWGTRTERIAVWGIMNQRVFVDLQAHLAGHDEIASQTPQIAVAIGQAATRAATVADLARGVLAALAQLPGVTLACFGRPNGDGIFQFEIGSGPRAAEFMAATVRDYGESDPATAAAPRGESPPARAWRTGEIARSDAYRIDPTTADWSAIAREFDIQASVAIPLADSDGEPRALIALYSDWPGFFAESIRGHVLRQTQQLVEDALGRIELRWQLTSGFSDVADRSAHIARLARGEVTMRYQPIIDLRTGDVVKFEALARLLDGDRLINPGEFLPSFGQSELWRLFEIGLDQGLDALAAWQVDGLTTGVSLNLPATFALTHDHGDAVCAALRRHDIEPGRLTLEVLESGAIEQETSGYRRVLSRIQELGVCLAEDDLGTAYSSLLRLRYLPFDEVKIAQELVRDSGGNPRETWGSIHPLANLVHQMGRVVTVEGLETVGLVEAAAYLGADCGQGYAIARPMPAAEVPGWARAFRLSIDPARPTTHLGALAAHLAWELRLGAVAARPDLAAGAADDPCPLTEYLLSQPPRPGDVAAAHRKLHDIATDGRHSTESHHEAHHEAWTHITALLIESAGAVARSA